MTLRLTIRARLALLYGAVFVFAGVLLISITYLLYRERLDDLPPRGPEGFAQAFGEPPIGAVRFQDFRATDGRTLPSSSPIFETTC